MYYCNKRRCPGHFTHLEECDSDQGLRLKFYRCGVIGCPGHDNSRVVCATRLMGSIEIIDRNFRGGPGQLSFLKVYSCGKIGCPGHTDSGEECVGTSIFPRL